jgi:hypothetical protein
MRIVNLKSKIVNGHWLPDMDLNHDKQIQSLLCYRYTIGQAGALGKLNTFAAQSRFVESLHRYIVNTCATIQQFNSSTI